VEKMDINERLKLIKSVGEEVVTEEELLELLKEKKKFVAYDGFEPSGQIHIAQGVLRAINVNKMTKAGAHFKMWVADWFGMINNKMGGDLNKIHVVGEYFIEVWKACGMDLENVEFIWTSQYIKQRPEYWETVLKLSMNATVQRVLRCGQIMGREESTSNPAAQILYPLMQASDIHHLGADVAQLGMDQRKVNMLAREIFPKLGFKKPIVVSHHMLMGLQQTVSQEKDTLERTIDLKMSKSKPDTAIFMTDTEEDINRKMNKAWCPEKETNENPVLEYFNYIIFEKYDFVEIKRPDKFGGNLKVESYKELEKLFSEGKIHPLDMKKCCAYYINELVKPVREHFEKNKEAKKLKELVESYQITR
jgi:tyrosyl-tRNA synthetase